MNEMIECDGDPNKFEKLINQKLQNQ